MGEVVPLSDERVAMVTVAESGEPLVDLRELGLFRLDPHRMGTVEAAAQLRAGVADRLAAAQTLLPRGLRLLVLRGYRPPIAGPTPELVAHSTGAAVDLSLCREDGHDLLSFASTEESAHRLVLGNALTAVGMVNPPVAWWHWSYGDRYWAFIVGRAAARYGAVHPPQ